MVLWQKPLTIPSLSKFYHRSALIPCILPENIRRTISRQVLDPQTVYYILGISLEVPLVFQWAAYLPLDPGLFLVSRKRSVIAVACGVNNRGGILQEDHQVNLFS